MNDDSAYNRNVNKRMQEELAEFNTPQARYQQALDRHWEAQRDLEIEYRRMMQELNPTGLKIW
jgi:hypothetical protein